MRRKKRRIKWKNVIIFVICLTCFIFLLDSIINIIVWKHNSNETQNQIDKIQNEVDIKEIDDNINTEIIEQEDIPKSNPYWDYINMKLIDVEIESLKGINDQTKGWLQVKGTNINYPVVQAKDNKYYLNHSFDKTYNDAGWVFLDYRNKFDGSDKNTIIYAHSRLDKTMFGSLRNILKSGWLNNTDNYIIMLSNEYENTLWQVFSVYHIPDTNDYLKVNFNDDTEFLNFTNMLIKRSAHNFNTTVSKDDKIITLSTCYSETEKVVLHAKLIKKQKRDNN